MLNRTNRENVDSRDPIYNSLLLGKFYRYLTKKGKLAKIETFMHKIFIRMKFRNNPHILLIFMRVFTRVKINIIITSLLVAGKRIFIPVPVSLYKQSTLPLRWLTSDANKNKRLQGVPFVTSLLRELELHYVNKSSAIKTVYRHHETSMRELRYNIHYRWQRYY